MKVEFQNVSFGYKSGRSVLQNIDLTIDGPGLYCIIGPNGVGKSTLIKCINGLLKPTSGTVLLNEQDVAAMSNHDIAMEVSYVPAVGSDCFSMPVIDTILIGRHNHQKWKTTAKDIEIVYKAMDMLGLRDLAMSGYNELSAGQHQKVSLARGLVQETEIMLLDEPTANLDVKHQVYVTEMLRTLADRDGKQIIMICHDLNIATRYASELIVMAPPGEIVAKGHPSDVMTSELVEGIYGIKCEIVTYENRPFVILKSTFTEDIA